MWTNENPTEVDKEREVARHRVEARMGLILHVAIYVVFNAGMLAIWSVGHTGYPWFLWPMFGWGIGVVAHAFAYWFGPGSTSESRAIARELDRMHRGGVR